LGAPSRFSFRTLDYFRAPWSMSCLSEKNCFSFRVPSDDVDRRPTQNCRIVRWRQTTDFRQLLLLSPYHFDFSNRILTKKDRGRRIGSEQLPKLHEEFPIIRVTKEFKVLFCEECSRTYAESHKMIFYFKVSTDLSPLRSGICFVLVYESFSTPRGTKGAEIGKRHELRILLVGSFLFCLRRIGSRWVLPTICSDKRVRIRGNNVSGNHGRPCKL
jgi:hypothetical protein